MATHTTGDNLIGGVPSRAGGVRLRAVDPQGGAALEPEFAEATTDEIELAAQRAEDAFEAHTERIAQGSDADEVRHAAATTSYVRAATKSYQ